MNQTHDVWVYIRSLRYVNVAKMANAILVVWEGRAGAGKSFAVKMAHIALVNKVDGINVDASFKDGKDAMRKLSITDLKVRRGPWTLIWSVITCSPISFSATCSNILVDGVTIIGGTGIYLAPDGMEETEQPR